MRQLLQVAFVAVLVAIAFLTTNPAIAADYQTCVNGCSLDTLRCESACPAVKTEPVCAKWAATDGGTPRCLAYSSTGSAGPVACRASCTSRGQQCTGRCQ